MTMKIAEIREKLAVKVSEKVSVNDRVMFKNTYALFSKDDDENAIKNSGKDLTVYVDNIEFRIFTGGDLPSFTDQTNSADKLRIAADRLEYLYSVVDFGAPIPSYTTPTYVTPPVEDEPADAGTPQSEYQLPVEYGEYKGKAEILDKLLAKKSLHIEE